MDAAINPERSSSSLFIWFCYILQETPTLWESPWTFPDLGYVGGVALDTPPNIWESSR